MRIATYLSHSDEIFIDYVIGSFTAAENEASSLDILVCGNCQTVFHFVEEFGEHKVKNDCEKADKSSLNSQVWLFGIFSSVFFLPPRSNSGYYFAG